MTLARGWRGHGVLRRHLSLRLAVGFLALGVTVVLLVTFVSYRSAEQALQRRLEERLNGLADLGRSSITEWVAHRRDGLRYVASSIESFVLAPEADHAHSDASAAGLTQHLKSAAVLQRSDVRLIQVPGGRVIASTDSTLLGTYAADELYYAGARDSTNTQRIYPTPRDGRPTLTIATPVRSGADQTVAVLATDLDLQEAERILPQRRGDVPIDAYLVDAYREFVSAERFGRADYRRGAQSEGIARAARGEEGGGMYVDYQGRPVIGAWRWLPDLGVALVVEAPQLAAFEPARRLLESSLLVGLFAIGLLSFGVVAIARSTTRPVLALAAAAGRVAQGDFTSEPLVTSDDEVGQLARSFNTMTTQLSSLYRELSEQVTSTTAALDDARASRSLLQGVVDNTTAIVVVVDLENHVRLANLRVERVLGLGPGEVLGRSVAHAFAGDAGTLLLAALDETRAQDAVVEREVVLGAVESHTWQAVTFPLRDVAGTTYALGIVASDLTERARAEEERRQHDATVQQAQKLESLGILAGGIAHDFNNILGAVLGHTELALATADVPADLRESLTEIERATRRAAELTRQMLAYAGRADLRREVTDLRAVLTDVLALVRASQSKKVEFRVLPMRLPLWVEVDPAQLSQVALNLLTNAAESIGDAVGVVSLSAGPSVPPSAPTDESKAGDAMCSWICFTVEDTGEGMTPEVRRRVFEPFFSTKRPGRGLGMSAVNGIIRSSGGVLQLESVVGVGTRFAVFLPAAADPDSQVRADAPATPMSRTGTVLVIDDEAALRRVCRRALERLGLRVLEAADGIEGLARFREHREELGLVILDLTMPGLGGAEVLTIIRSERPLLPVVIASGYDHAESADMIATDAITRFLQKPYGLEALTRIVGESMP